MSQSPQPMSLDNEAFEVLHAIACGAANGFDDGARWVEAFRTIRWVAQSTEGLVLTAEGRAAHEDILQAKAALAGDQAMASRPPAFAQHPSAPD